MTGDYFSWLSHDDMYYPNKIEREVEELGKLEDKNTIMMSDLDCINEKGEKIYETKYLALIEKYPPRERSYIYPVVYNQTHGCTLLIPRKCFDEVGVFDEQELVAQDFEFFYRAFLKFPHKLIPEVLVTARDSSNRQGKNKRERCIIEYSNLYISIIESLTERDIKLLAPDKISFYYDMQDFFTWAGYTIALDYVNQKIVLSPATVQRGPAPGDLLRTKVFMLKVYRRLPNGIQGVTEPVLRLIYSFIKAQYRRIRR
jgi:hypothetical protein